MSITMDVHNTTLPMTLFPQRRRGRKPSSIASEVGKGLRRPCWRSKAWKPLLRGGAI